MRFIFERFMALLVSMLCYLFVFAVMITLWAALTYVIMLVMRRFGVV